MVPSCHRCGGEITRVSGESTFCPNCGAPQLRVLEENVAVKVDSRDGVSAADDSSISSATEVVWATAVAYAAGVAGVSAALMIGVLWLPAAFPLAWLWTMCGAVIVLGLYQRRYPASRVNARTGARIGLVYGLLAVVALVVVTSGIGVVARFGLHTMGTLDALLGNAMHQAADQQMQQSSQPGGLSMSADQLRMFYSPEVRAGLALFLLTSIAVFLTLFSALGGALGGLMRMRRR